MICTYLKVNTSLSAGSMLLLITVSHFVINGLINSKSSSNDDTDIR